MEKYLNLHLSKYPRMMSDFLCFGKVPSNYTFLEPEEQDLRQSKYLNSIFGVIFWKTVGPII
jgi:hypothetical protein